MSDSDSRPPRRRPLRTAAVLLTGALLVTAGALLHWDDQLLLNWRERGVDDQTRALSVWLPDYRLSLETRLPGLEDDETSGLTWSPLTGTLFTVTGQNPQLVEISPQGVILRRIPLEGFSDPEAVASLGDGRLGIVDERRRLLAVFALPESDAPLRLEELATYDLGFSDAGNKGFEGLAWDSNSTSLLLAKERDPLGLYSLPFPGEDGAVGAPVPLSEPGLMVRDLSSVAVDPRTGHTLLLSDESRLLLELDREGQPLSFIRLLGGLNGLEQSIDQAEGLAMDDQGRIYLVGEPNRFYVFERQAR